MEFYTKQKVVGIFVLGLEHQGYSNVEALEMIRLRPYVVEDVMAIQTSFTKMFDGVHKEVKDFFCTEDQLKRFMSRVINKELEKILKFPNRLEKR